jgi:hypothetical protein
MQRGFGIGILAEDDCLLSRGKGPDRNPIGPLALGKQQIQFRGIGMRRT